MKVSVVGVGYVGLVAGTCFADGGNHVICVDSDKRKIDKLKNDELPIYEPGLLEIVQRNVKAGRLSFTTDLAEAVANSLVIFLAVGTPPASDGSADLSAALSVAEEIARLMDGYRIVVMKSTVPVGTHKIISDAIARGTDHQFDYVSNPEFLKEGMAIEDFMRPDRVVLGATNPAVFEIMKQLYAPFMRKEERFLTMDPASAELTKYAANALLATKISFINEIALLCEKVGADVSMVRKGVGSDSRLGPAFLFPGVGYGGSCFPKDVSALVAAGESLNCPMHITRTVNEVNQRQREMFADRVIDYFGGRCASARLAVWGLAFKARTDDVRESPALYGVERFLDAGFTVRAFDPEAMETARAVLGERLVTVPDGYEALEGADALVIFTDWQEFRTPDFERIARTLNKPLVFDGRNLYEPAQMKKMGIEYHCIGRPT
ncbi:MAG: UDP-glucose/GDP-mannose dehydrogenase family protein [Phycisphaerales bacterium]|nr:MAG: UDP-glucose/GDP-mannose dehydrogenase family protein [Phycisphaerales bacterium]